MRLRYLLPLVVALVALLAFLGGCGKADPAAGYPSKAIEYVTHTAPGGPQYLVGQLIADISQKEKIFSQPVVMTQKPGSGMAAGFAYMLEKKGDPHIIGGVPLGLLLGTPLLEKLPYSYKDFTPIANMVADGSVLVVSAKSPYNTIQDLVADAKKRPREITQGGSSMTSNEALMGRTMQKAGGFEWKFVSFKEESEAVTNVIGGNITFAFLNPTSVIDHVRAGNLRVILAGAPQRYTAFKDVPTVKEAGLGDPIISNRGLFGPPGMPDYAAKKWEAATKQIVEHAAFKDFMDKAMQQPQYMGAADYAKFVAAEFESRKAVLTELGLLK